ncbi:MAG: type III pantothenate kinase [Dehalococcoidia bacterium]|nr:MAG: type III pantothenate kinase [Dehalococcoidia bacterium]
MLLAVDIGNTETTLGVFKGEKLMATWHIATVINRTADEFAPILISLLDNKGLKLSDISEVSFCSVVPPLTATFEEIANRYLGVSPLVIAAGIKTGVRVCMDNPKEVGADRVVNAAAAQHLYGGPLIIIDLGTATTFDIVSEKGDYMGGAIAPGIVTATEAMFHKAAMLPRVELMPPERVVGTNTIDAMKSGIIFGYVGLVEGMVARIKRELGVQLKTIATGGYAQLIAAETKVIDEVSCDLTLIGLRLIYQMNES